MSDIFFSKFDSEYFSLIIFLKYLFILLLIMISFIIMTLLEKNKICRTFRAVGHLGTLQTSVVTFTKFTARKYLNGDKLVSDSNYRYQESKKFINIA